MTKRFYICDPGNGESCETTSLEEAIEIGNQWIGDYRDACDPEWSLSVEDLVVILTPFPMSEDDREEYGQVVARSKMINRQEVAEEDREACGVEFYCDYAMVAID